MSVIVNVPIPDNLVPVLDRKARNAGLERDQYARAILFRELNASRNLDDVLASFREQIAASGLTDPELDRLFESAHHEKAR